MYSLLHLECHVISISNLNFLGLLSTESGKRDQENTLQHTATHSRSLGLFFLVSFQRKRDLENEIIDSDGILNQAHCNTLQHTATHCNTLQHTATHWWNPQSGTESFIWWIQTIVVHAVCDVFSIFRVQYIQCLTEFVCDIFVYVRIQYIQCLIEFVRDIHPENEDMYSGYSVSDRVRVWYIHIY